jgi:hypothetical protein
MPPNEFYAPLYAHPATDFRDTLVQVSILARGATHEMLLKLPRLDVLRLAKELWLSEASTGLRQYADDRKNKIEHSSSPRKQANAKSMRSPTDLNDFDLNGHASNVESST